MTYISRKTRLLVPRWFDECDPAYLYHLNRKRSDGRLKRHGSCDDLRAWVDDQYLNYQHLLELMTDGEFQRRPFLGLMGRIIPVENILDVLCGDALNGGEGSDKAVGSRLGKPSRKPREVDGSDFQETVNLAAKDDILKITNAAMSKLENISNLLQSTSDSQTNRPCEEENDSNLKLSGDNPSPDEVVSEYNRNREEYLAEYNSILRKISCLRHRLGAIKQRRKELCAKFQSSRQAICRSSSDMTIKELYSREEQMQAKRLQKRIEELVKEKGQVLNEMCEALKYLNELKKIDTGVDLLSHKKVLSPEKQRLKNPRKCPCSNESHEDGFKKEKDGSGMSSGRRKKRDVGNSDSEVDLRGGRSQEDSSAKYPQQLINNSDTVYPNNTKEDWDLKAVFASDFRTPESQKTQEDFDKAGDRKSKSESTVNDLEQILRSYEKRLSDLGYIEVQIEELKKRASMASYFKKRWLRCSTRGRAQKIEERRRMKEEMKHLYMENNDLKKLIVKLTAKSEREQNEIQYLKCKHKQLSEMEEEMTELKKDLQEYQISFETQRECIDSLENTVTRQRDRIQNLMTHIARLGGATDTVKDIGRISKKCPRSRSYGPEGKKNSKKMIVTSSEESRQSSTGCHCCNCTYHSEAPNRPRSECTRRMTLVPQTWRRQSCNN